jgi:tetratricopeptide (TPR) repeat protein
MGSRRWPKHREALFPVALSLALVAIGSTVCAQTDDENARRHFESGAAYLQQSDNEDALREFQAAYALSKRPPLLLNIAAVYERMGKPDQAIEALNHYLEADPSSADRTTIETRIANLKKRAEGAAPSEPPKPANPPTPPPPVATPPVGGAPTQGVEPPAEPKEPVAPQRTPAYIAFGAGGAAAIGAVITGIIAKSKFDDASNTCKPNCADSKVDPVKSMALVSDILTGVAVVGVGVGAVLFFTAKSEGAPPSRAPALSAGVSPSAARIDATWRF